MSAKQLLICLVLSICTSTILADPQCLNQKNQTVDWFIALKFPSGTNYAYCDSIDCSQLYVQTDLLDNLTTSPLFNTMGQIQNINSTSYSTVFWNDEPPNLTVSSSYAHSKGFIGTGLNTGFIMVHSTPLFPIITNGVLQKQIDSGQTIYGQHYFCVSTTGSNLNQIASAYNIDWPYVYGGNIPSSFSSFTYLSKMLSNTKDTSVNYKTISFQTLAGVNMYKFAKSAKWVVPFYDNVPAAILQTGLVVESWRYNEPSDCNQTYTVTNNLIVSFPNSVSYKETVDHSKYAISLNPSLPYVCLGDINRATSQWSRGGGTVCFSNPQVFSNFQTIMSSQSTC